MERIEAHGRQVTRGPLRLRRLLQPRRRRGRLFHLATPLARPGGPSQSQIREGSVDRLPPDVSVLGFAQDCSGEVYLVSNATGTPFGDTGTIHRITRRR